MMYVNGIAIGECVYGSELSIIDYSRKDRDTFGNITIIERGYTDLIKYVVEISATRVHEIKLLLANCRATKIAYVVKNNLGVNIPELCVEGYISNMSIPLEAYSVNTITFEVESDPQDVPGP
jgi:hypothetical protein